MTDEKSKATFKSLPDFLRMTPAQIEQSNQIQEQVRQAMHGRVQANQDEAPLVRAIHAERAARATLEAMQAAKPFKGRAAALKQQLARLADSLADQGRYLEAADLHPLKTRAKEFQAVQAALDRPDGDRCNCAPLLERDPASGQTLRIPTHNRIANVYSLKAKRFVPLIRCEKCGHLNARAFSPDGPLARRERAIATPLTGSTKVPDIQLLK